MMTTKSLLFLASAFVLFVSIQLSLADDGESVGPAEAIGKKLDAAAGSVKQTMTDAGQSIGKAFEKAKDGASKALNSAGQKIGVTADEVKAKTGEVVDEAGKALVSAKDKASDTIGRVGERKASDVS